MANGDLARAVAVVEPADLASPRSEAEVVAATECIGLLAWLEALRGNLTAAGRHAAEVLRIRPADGDEVGVAYAQLAAAWVHLERGELAEAGQRLDHTIACRHQDPRSVAGGGPAAGHRAGGHPPGRAGPRRTAADRPPSRPTRPLDDERWLADRCTVALAEAQLAAGDARRALAVLTPEPRAGAGGGPRPGRARPSRDR